MIDRGWQEKRAGERDDRKVGGRKERRRRECEDVYI